MGVGQRIAKLPEGTLNHLQKKILFTLGFLALYRIGVHIPIPGVDTAALSDFFKNQGANLFGMFNMFSGGALQRFSVCALGIMPYISASIIAQLLTVVVPHLEQLSKEGDAGRKKITQYTRYGAVVLAIVQGVMIANTLESSALGGRGMVLNPGLVWKFVTVLSLAAGTAFIMWLGEQITERGVGNGMSLIIFAGIVATIPNVITSTYKQYANAEMDAGRVLLILGVCLAVTAGVVFIEQGARQIPIQYAKRQVGKKVYGGQNSHLPVRVNSAGVIPPIFASSLLQFPVTIQGLWPDTPIGSALSLLFHPGGWFYNLVYVVMIVFFAFFYTSITFKADDIAENLKKHGGFIPGIRPGARTSEFLDKVVSRLTLTGGLYLAALCVLPALLTSQFNIQFYFGGTSLLIVVGVALETFRQIDAHRQSLRYDAFLKGTAIRSRTGGSRI
ncbi:MAG: preprotein translocase subunit SecY [Proteobacteria bacterium]|jgi:preprotein translocase subunit SecY|nr:preprotein translocase subunit SecY [Pseudomonadota bacterium]